VRICCGGNGAWVYDRRATQTVVALVAASRSPSSASVADGAGLLPPAVDKGEYAVNQRAEQIIFEVEQGWVTAHVHQVLARLRSSRDRAGARGPRAGHLAGVGVRMLISLYRATHR
jgi:hypothetical protein